MQHDQIKKYAEFVASRLDTAIAAITDEGQRAALRAALGPAIALSGVCACGLDWDSPSIAHAMLVCATDMAGAGMVPGVDPGAEVTVSVPGPDGAQ